MTARLRILRAYTPYSLLFAVVCDQRFVLRMPASLPLDASAPLLCAGITVYSPMRVHGLDKAGLRLGVLGLGGLGSMAVRFGKAFGCEVTVISTSPSKEAEARALGATKFLLSSDKEAMKAAAGSLDGIIDTVAAKHDLGTYLNLLDVDGKLILVGVAPESLDLHAFAVSACTRHVNASSAVFAFSRVTYACAFLSRFPQLAAASRSSAR